jgi:paraquat-inducible protein A
VVFAVSIFFPFLKLFYLLTLVASPDLSPEFRRRSISTMEWLGRYSMTDVMVLALMIFYVNSSGYTEAIVMPGVYFFAASALITMLAYGWVNTVPARPQRPQLSAGEVVTLPTNPGRRHRPAQAS